MKILVISPKRERFEKDRLEFWEFGFMANVAGIGNRKFSGTPLALPIIASLIPDDIDATLVDENVEEINFDTDADLVVLTFFTVAATRGYQIADKFREKKIPVVIGGCHASMVPEEAAEHADTVAIGEAEVLFPKILSDFRNKGLKPVYRINDSQRPKLDRQPTPRWDCLKLNKYFNPTIQTMRGCPFKCEFCTVRVHWGAKYRFKPIHRVVEEVESLKKEFGRNTFFMIVDDDIAANPIRAKKLFKALLPLKIQWMSQGSMAMAKDEEYLALMTKSGGTRIIMGLESIHEASLIEMQKNPANKLNDYIHNIRKIQSYGIAIIGAFVFGFDQDDGSCFESTADFIIENHIALPQLFSMTPFPGTRLAERLEQEGRILSKDWKRYTGSTVLFQPKLMTIDELEKGYYQTIQKVYAYAGIWKRLSGLWKLFDENASKYKPLKTIIKEKIDLILLNENFRAVAYSYPIIHHTDENQELFYKKELQNNLRQLLNQRNQLIEAETGIVTHAMAL